MKKLIKIILVMLLLWTTDYGLRTANAAVPHLLNYQGRLTNLQGQLVSDGNYSVTFRIYNAESGGSLLWEETQSVTVTKGLFNVLLGGVNSLSLPFDSAYWIEIKVGNEVMNPRQRITSSGYAIRAENSEKLDNQDSSYYKNASNINAGILAVTQGGTGRNSKLSVSQVIGTTDISGTDSETDMPNMSITLTTYGTKLLVVFSASILDSLGGQTALFYINIDGINRRKFYVWPNDYATLQHLETGLTPGPHTIKIRWKTNGWVYQQGATLSERILTCIDLD